jgi:hypothetical protein
MYDDIKILKLLNGEEIIARVREEDLFYYIKKVRSIIDVPSQNFNEMAVAVTCWSSAADDEEEIKISSSNVMTERTPKEEFKNQYISNSTGLVL